MLHILTKPHDEGVKYYARLSDGSEIGPFDTYFKTEAEAALWERHIEQGNDNARPKF